MLLKALSTMCKSCSQSLIDPPAPSVTKGAQSGALGGSLAGRIAGAVRAQCLKRDVAYKTAAVECLGDVLEQLKVDMFVGCYQDVILPILEPVRRREGVGGGRVEG